MDTEMHKKILDCLYDGVYFVDPENKITYWNNAAEKITGYKKEEVLGFRCSDDILRHINDKGDQLCIMGCPLKRSLEDGRLREADVYLHHKNGHRVPVSVRVSPIQDEKGNIIGAAEIFSENSRKMDMLKELEVLKNHVYTDALTLVGNRRFAELTLNARFNELKTFGIPFGVLFFDLDGFKTINDTYGHEFGDNVLKMVAKTVMNIIRSLDVICRWGGDEFVVIAPNITHDNLNSIAQKIRTFIETSWVTKSGETIRVTASIGAAVAEEKDTAKDLIKKVDQLMYEAKKAGKNAIIIS